MGRLTHFSVSSHCGKKLERAKAIAQRLPAERAVESTAQSPFDLVWLKLLFPESPFDSVWLWNCCFLNHPLTQCGYETAVFWITLLTQCGYETPVFWITLWLSVAMKLLFSESPFDSMWIWNSCFLKHTLTQCGCETPVFWVTRWLRECTILTLWLWNSCFLSHPPGCNIPMVWSWQLPLTQLELVYFMLVS